MAEISKYATVERGAKLASDVKVGPFSYIGSQVRIGPGCVIHNNVTITGKTTIGERNMFFPLSVVGTAQGKSGEGELIVGEGNVIREHVTVCGGHPQPTRIGTDNLIMIGCQIGGGCNIGNHGIFVNGTHIGQGATIEDYVRTSAFILIEPNVTIGAYTFTLGYAEIDRDAPPFAMVQGSPFRVRGINTENLKRCGFGEDEIRALKSAMRELYNGSGDTPDPVILARLLEDSQPSIRRLAEAVKVGQARRNPA